MSILTLNLKAIQHILNLRKNRDYYQKIRRSHNLRGCKWRKLRLKSNEIVLQITPF